uniref:Uncharacterized protein n=1 Tax=Cucumis melo TaxID=3656 RepID=A0A9I9EIX8_CUCME
MKMQQIIMKLMSFSTSSRLRLPNHHNPIRRRRPVSTKVKLPEKS